MTDIEPKDTCLINIPVIHNNKQSSCLIYLNNMNKTKTLNEDFEKSSMVYTNSMTGDSSDGYAVYDTNWENSNSSSRKINNEYEKKYKSKAEIMVVPIPNFTNQTSFGLVDLSNDIVKTLKYELELYRDSILPQKPSLQDGVMMSFSNNSMGSKIPIVEVGNYYISVASGKDDLDNINWKEFDLPADFKKRYQTLDNNYLYPYKMGYIIAKTYKSIKDDGFGVIYENPENITYFPTAHEDTGSEIVNYDFTCYDFTNKVNNLNFRMPQNLNLTAKYINMNKYYIYKTQNSYDKHNFICEYMENNNAMQFSNEINNDNLNIILILLKKLNLNVKDSMTNEEKEAYLNEKLMTNLNILPVNKFSYNQNIWSN